MVRSGSGTMSVADVLTWGVCGRNTSLKLVFSVLECLGWLRRVVFGQW